MILSLFCVICFTHGSYAQCAAPINVFPYNEGFEANDGGWTSGGVLSDWAWGTPAKTVINGAAGGAKCWIVGGLTGSSYNDGERSWLQSPCFDFTALQYPYISFHVFWEMEQRFDGAGFQYSTDLGVTWSNVGAVSDPVNCLNGNWFNYTPVQFLNTLATVRDGWSGNIQTTAGSCLGGNGSGRWAQANHTMPNLAGEPNVIFRFIFGAGTTCNAFEGFAVDDILISNAPPNNASFTYSCTNSTTVAFSNTSDLCPATNWDFGDPASGANNNSTLPNPTHIFSAPGTYIITLTATGPANAPSTYFETIHILGLTPLVISNNNCFGDTNGAATVSVSPAAAAPYFYSWNTTPVQSTQTITGLPGGSYTVTVSALNSCTSSATVDITEPLALSHTLNIIQPGCAAATGSATITESGGTSPYTYSWSPSGGNAATATGLSPGNYTVTVTDSKGCTDNVNINIAPALVPVISISNKKDVSCFGQSDGSATALATGGNAPYSYNWSTVPAQNTATASNLKAGTYTITVTDNNGCTASTSTQITEPVAGSCSDVYFPNAFTPDGNSRNEDFGALGNIAAISNYLLLVYNRYGELVFYTRNPGTRWNGLYKGKLLSGAFVWAATFTYKGQFKREEKGSVTIIR
ncbi:MAG: gliding motility-associated C-terminal domain-containing protein [Chitinophagaceae bacterium]|nr:gliding motility-associated C-terminal domain-containing protein [Chitinophagaceae bacterium]